jgi:hypothetical protein
MQPEDPPSETSAPFVTIKEEEETPSSVLSSILGPDHNLLSDVDHLVNVPNPLDTLVAALPGTTHQYLPLTAAGLLPTTIAWQDSTQPAFPLGDQWLTEFLMSATVPDAGSYPNSSLLSSLIPATNVGWGFSESPDMFDPIKGPLSPEQRERHKHQNLLEAVYPEEVDGVKRPAGPVGRKPNDSDWPSVYRPSSPEHVLDLPEPAQRRDDGTNDGSGVPAHTRTMMESLAKQAHSACWPMPNLGNFPSESGLTACVNLYLNRFAEWLPIIDSPRGTFDVSKGAPLLLKAMAAVGSVYARDGLERLGTPLAELVRREITYIVSTGQVPLRYKACWVPTLDGWLSRV